MSNEAWLLAGAIVFGCFLIGMALDGVAKAIKSLEDLHSKHFYNLDGSPRQ